MLARIETAYLAILRIVVLVAATCALLVALYASLTSLPALARQFGDDPAAGAQGGALNEYIERRRATAPARPGKGGAASSSAAEPRSSNKDVQEAAKGLQRYGRGANGMTIPKWERQIEQLGENMPMELGQRFYSETRALVGQLNTAKGKKLDTAALNDLLAWNRAQLVEDAQSKAGEQARDTASAMFKLYIAGVAFLLFIIVIFTFLFVRVERSLRVVRTVRLGEMADA